MAENYQIDSTDRKILELLQKDARRPYLEIARKLNVSGGTIHQRIEKLREAGIITGSQITLNPKKLGLNVTVLLGLHLNNARDIEKVIAQLKTFPEVVEAQFTTGSFALIIKVMVADIGQFHSFLVHKIQSMPEIQSTESFICLNEPIFRSFPVTT
ncbi:MAG: Lrp/AsnC ligand binding domain-containing protein [Bdellovibrionales bacterium]|nr:Lrp/AsnC ligand binding domain-containing protein [Bdellovibrionales bacterium]